MKNALLFYYGIGILNDNLNKINNDYYFTYQNSNFLVAAYERNVEEVIELYNLTEEMISNNIPLYKIVLTKDNNALFTYENINYILMIMPKVKNRVITYHDVINFNYTPIRTKYSKLDKSSWTQFWANKIDYIEYQFSQIEKKYSMIKESINFYVGMWENAISYSNINITKENGQKCVCHKRLTTKTDLLWFLNPLNLVIDYKERDVSEYIKSFALNERYSLENLNSFLNEIPMDRNVIIRFISRTLFPSDYFDMYEKIIYDKTEEVEIIKVINNKKNYLILLKAVFKYFEKYNIPLIDWVLNEKIKLIH